MGATGPQGSPDTPEQILDKLLTVDGPGSGLDADLLDGIHASGFWQLDGNAGTTPGSDFLGTTDDTSLDFRVNDVRALRIEPAADNGAPAPNLIGGSPDNEVVGDVYAATIAGGGGDSAGNTVTESGATVSGGVVNQAGGFTSVVSGGRANTASGLGSTIAGGDFGSATGNRSTVSGGNNNVASGQFSAIGGGLQNSASGTGSVVGGGLDNVASADFSSINGGRVNAATGIFSAIGGGIDNVASGQFSTVVGGNSNTAAGDFSLVAGLNASSDASHPGVFLFGDSTGEDFNSVAANEFAVRASGGIRLFSSPDLSTGCEIEAGSGAMSCTSDRNTKQDFQPLDGEDVLAKLEEVPVTSWIYKTDPAGTRHIGPMAQDFFAAFGVGSSDRTISGVDADGVSLAAAKALSRRTQVLIAKNRKLEAKNRSQDALIADLERRLSALED